MNNRLSEQWFRALRANTVEARGLQNRVHEVLSHRELQSFDGFGHFLDEVLPEDPERVEQIAFAIHISASTLSRLRASRLDPFSVPLEPLMSLGYALGLVWEQISELVAQDHARFASAAGRVVERGDSVAADEQLRALRSAWDRVAADDATDL